MSSVVALLLKEMTGSSSSVLENVFRSPPAASRRTSTRLPSFLARARGTKFHHLVAEILGIADAGWLFDFLQFVVEGAAVEDFAVSVAEFLVLDPEIGISDVTVEDIIAQYSEYDSR